MGGLARGWAGRVGGRIGDAEPEMLFSFRGHVTLFCPSTPFLDRGLKCSFSFSRGSSLSRERVPGTTRFVKDGPFSTFGVGSSLQSSA